MADFVFNNDGSVNDLELMVGAVLDKIGKNGKIL
jgi:hypothetical protein